MAWLLNLINYCMTAKYSLSKPDPQRDLHWNKIIKLGGTIQDHIDFWSQNETYWQYLLKLIS